jgi:hypothetical protein
MKHAILLLLSILLLRAVQAQGPGQAQAYIGAPHEVSLLVGSNEISIRVVALLQCTAGMQGPGPLQVIVAAGAKGPDDGNGSAWTFAPTSWNFTWSDEGSGNFSIDETFTIDVDAQGYGDRGYFGEFTVTTVALRNASSSACTSTGYTIPARGGHAHIQVGPRPMEQSKDSPMLAAPILALALVAVALSRRSA